MEIKGGFTEYKTPIQLEKEIVQTGINGMLDSFIARTMGKDEQDLKADLQKIKLNEILNYAVKNEASDVHLVSGQPTIIRIHGELIPVGRQPLNAKEIKDMIYSILTDKQRERFERELELDLSYVADFGHFRVNVHQERGRLGSAFRYIPMKIKGFEELGLPKILENLSTRQKGIVLVTGPSGSGKSTTLAAMVDYINRQRRCMIISLEDPIEFYYQTRNSVIRQREIGHDSRSFVNGLKYALRQDVDVILLGEIRDLETISIALTAAETGHLVLTTLHTIDAITTVNRIIDVFPGNQQQQVRIQLAETLAGVIAQMLVPRKNGGCRVVATEVLVSTPAVVNLIRNGNTEQIINIIQTNRDRGMHLMDDSLLDLYKREIISQEALLTYARDPSKFSI